MNDLIDGDGATPEDVLEALRLTNPDVALNVELVVLNALDGER